MTSINLVVKVFDGRIDLPEEALAVLPANTWLRAIVNPTNGTVCIHAEQPPGQEITKDEESVAWHAAWGALHPGDETPPKSPEEIVHMFKERRQRLRREDQEREARGDLTDPDA